MDDFINVIKRDPQVQIKIKVILDKNNRLLYKHQSKIGYEKLVQNVILKEMINLMGSTLVGIDIELKLKNSSINYLESKLL